MSILYRSHPLDVTDSKTEHVHQRDCKEGKLRPKYSLAGLKSILGLVFVHESTQYFVVYAIILSIKTFCLTASVKKQHLLIGFGNWRKALQRFREHDKSILTERLQ